MQWYKVLKQSQQKDSQLFLKLLKTTVDNLLQEDKLMSEVQIEKLLEKDIPGTVEILKPMINRLIRNKGVTNVSEKIVATDAGWSYEFARDLWFTNVPNSIVQRIATNTYWSYCFAKGLGFKNVPNAILQRIATNAEWSYEFAKDLGFKNVPNSIVQGIATDAWWFYQFTKALGFKNVPKTIMDKVKNKHAMV